MSIGELDETRAILQEISATTAQILEYAIVIMVAAILVALAIMYVVDQSKFMKGKEKEIDSLNKHVKSLEKSRAEGFKRNGETSDAADTLFGMYLDEKEKAEKFAEWDSKQVKRITALEKQLRENGIEPVKWDDIKATV